MDIQKIESKFEEIETLLSEELNERIEDLKNLIDIEESKIIKDLDNFIWKLKLENLYDEKLERFINDYMKFYNK